MFRSDDKPREHDPETCERFSGKIMLKKMRQCFAKRTSVKPAL